MIDEEIVKKLRERYPQIPLLIFHRSVEKSKTAGELFDILDSFKHKYPIVWSESSRKWIHTADLSQYKKFDFGEGKDD